ncbi:hypothetical protein [Clostridium sp. C2-6-12]|uniref:hypothetical protein n=1 Tax=Clostridium sp. C2-6-12 TaxID=2698832 RepID=UPI00136BE997|nr:hypothetical protein [Clostridium sp. C2-6-12]
MNYRAVKTHKSNLIHFQFNKNTTHNKASIIFKNIINDVKSFVNYLFTSSSYAHDEYYTNQNFYHETATDLRLKASQRTFL